MDKIILKDNTEIEVLQMPSLGSITVSVADLAAIQTLKDQLSVDNLSKVTIKNDAGLTTGIYEDLNLSDTWIIKWVDDAIEATFGLAVKSDIEKRLDAVETGQSIQDGAIADLGTAVSDITEGGNA